MTVNRFWNWEQPPDPPGVEESSHRVLRIGGVIAADSWFDDDVTPGIFRSELEAGAGPIQVWIKSPGGDCVAAAAIDRGCTARAVGGPGRDPGDDGRGA